METLTKGEPQIINSFQELMDLIDEKPNRKGREFFFTLSVALEKIVQPTVICITDISLEKGYNECGIIIDKQTISFTWDIENRIIYDGEYLGQKTMKLVQGQSYTIKVTDDTVWNIVVTDQDIMLMQASDLKTHSNKNRKTRMYYLACFYFIMVIIALLWRTVGDNSWAR